MSSYHARKIFFLSVASIIASIIIMPLGHSVYAQTSTNQSKESLKDQQPFNSYKGVKLGTSSDEVFQKLNTYFSETTDSLDVLMISEVETAVIYYDKQKKVSAIVITYSGPQSGAPDPITVFGEKVDANPDGSVFKVVQYTDSKYLVSYQRTAGEEQTTIVAIQKIP